MRPHGDASFTRFQRMLLGTDGTVTHVLEAYAGEPVEVVKLHQELSLPQATDAELELSAEEKVLRRRVLIKTVQTDRTLLYAEATVVVMRVEPAVLDGLVSTDKPIGILLAEHRVETFREILRVGRELAGPTSAYFGMEPDAELVARTYRIVHRGRPMILITEKFPLTSFRAVTA
ncbi:MAG TPA: chorismate pyruvate-lyase family protein [Acidimicrobiales bacterium]|nr:chorismate pyruvate-lyase family protein [Acidimicrobiales bacterium]